MRFLRRYLFLITIVLLIISAALIASADKIHKKPSDFTIDQEQRQQFYPENWYFSGGFYTTWEMTDYDGTYAYYSEKASHSYEVHFETELINQTHIEMVFNPVITDNLYYGSWFFNLSIFDLTGNTELAFIYDYWNLTETVILPELEGYKFTLDIAYLYFACLSSSGDTCLVSDFVLDTFSTNAYLDYSIIIWDEVHQGFIQFLYILFFSIIILPFGIEYALNYRKRDNVFKIVFGLLNVALFAIALEEWIKVGKTLSENRAENLSFRGLKAEVIILIAAIVIYWIAQLIEYRRRKTRVQEEPIEPSYSYQIPVQRTEEGFKPKKQVSEEKVSSRICNNCGAKLSRDSMFCTECGSKLN